MKINLTPSELSIFIGMLTLIIIGFLYSGYKLIVRKKREKKSKTLTRRQMRRARKAL